MKRARDRRRHIFAIARSLRRAVLVVTCALAGCISPYKQGAGKFDTVIIDAGHGGHDRGGRAISGSPEKVLALDTARRLAAILRTKGFRVIETRTRDAFVSLGSRVASSNSTRNSIFVSIHYNWAPRRGARGVEVYYFSPRSWRLASNILRQATRAYPAGNRGIKRNNFYVLRENRRPAVLCELAFLSNTLDNRNAQSSLNRQRLDEFVEAGIDAERQSAER